MSDDKQLIYEQRCQIEALNKSGMAQHEIVDGAHCPRSARVVFQCFC